MLANNYLVSVYTENEVEIQTNAKQLEATNGKVYLTRLELTEMLALLDADKTNKYALKPMQAALLVNAIVTGTPVVISNGDEPVECNVYAITNVTREDDRMDCEMSLEIVPLNAEDQRMKGLYHAQTFTFTIASV